MTIAQIEGRARGAGSEFVLNCDMRFAARGRALLAQNEATFGLIPGGGGAQQLVRLLGRGRALEVMLSAGDYDAQLAERYGWITRSFEPSALAPFVAELAHRIARMPASGHAIVTERVNAISLPPVEDYRRDSDLFDEGVTRPEAQRRIHAAIKSGFQNRDGEMNFGQVIGTWEA